MSGIQTSESRTMSDCSEDDFSFILTISAIWKHRIVIGLGTFLLTVASIMGTGLLSKIFIGTGIFQLISVQPGSQLEPDGPVINARPNWTGIPPQEYKIHLWELQNQKRLLQFQNHFRTSRPESGKGLSGFYPNAEKIPDLIKPVYLFSREDLIQIGNIPPGIENTVIGLNLKSEAASPQLTLEKLQFLGAYITDTLIYTTLFHHFEQAIQDSTKSLYENENLQIRVRFKLVQLLIQADELREIYNRYGISDLNIQRRADLLEMEYQIADLRRAAESLEKDRKRIEILNAFYSACSNLMKNREMMGETALQRVLTIREQHAGNQNESNDISREVYNQLSIEIKYLTDRFDGFRFASAPVVPDKPATDNKRVIGVAAFFLSFFVLTVYAILLEWWKRNKSIVLNGDLLTKSSLQ